MTDHCILDLKAQAFRCRACHGWQLLSLPPLPLAELVRRADEFNTRHHDCKNHDQDSH